MTGDRGCDGLATIQPLAAADIPADAEGVLARLAAVGQDATAEALGRHTWLQGDATSTLPGPVDITLAAAFDSAVTAEDTHVVHYLDSAEGSIEVIPARSTEFGGLDFGAQGPWALATDDRATVVLRASRFSTWIADLCDDVATALGGPVNAALLRGRLPPSHQMGERFNLIAAVTGPTTSAPEIRRMRSGKEVGSPGATRILLYGHEPTVDDVWDFTVRKANHWPRLRADLPYDLGLPVVAYGYDETVEVVPLLLDEFSRLLSADTVADAMRTLRARLRPVPRPFSPVGAVSDDLDQWMEVTVRGHVPGGVFHLPSVLEDEHVLVMAGLSVCAPVHLVPLIEAIAGRDGVAVSTLVECPHGDDRCAARAVRQLAAHGLITIVS